MGVVNSNLRDETLVLADDACGLAKADAGLLAVSRGEDRLAAGAPLRSA